MAISFINAQSQTSTTTSVTVTKPTNTSDGDFMIAFLTVGSNITSAPSGWTLHSGFLHDNVNWSYVYWKIAASEGASYQWQFGSATMVASIATYRGDKGKIQIHSDRYFSQDTGDPVTTPTIVTAATSKILYYTARRQGAVGVMTYTAGSGSERFDTGVGNVSLSYSHAMYEDAATETAPGTIAGLAITDNGTATVSHNRTIALSEYPWQNGWAVQM